MSSAAGLPHAIQCLGICAVGDVTERVPGRVFLFLVPLSKYKPEVLFTAV